MSNNHENKYQQKPTSIPKINAPQNQGHARQLNQLKSSVPVAEERYIGVSLFLSNYFLQKKAIIYRFFSFFMLRTIIFCIFNGIDSLITYRADDLASVRHYRHSDVVEVDYKPIIIALFIGFHLTEILAGVFWNKDKIRKDDIWIEIIGTGFYIIIAAPLIFYSAPVLTEFFFPGAENNLAHLSWWQMLIILLIIDEGLHYWWHRLTHEIPWMYNLHRAHHSCEYMSVRLAFRNNLFYFLIMPSVWASAILLHLGFGPVYAVYIIVKMTVNFGSHSPLKWDAWMYRIPALSPAVWVLERIITTPAAHAAHHGRYKEDGITHYKGNYANLFFFWDVLFGTAKLTRDYPKEYGVENIEPKSWKHEMFWPLIREKEPETLTESQSPHSP